MTWKKFENGKYFNIIKGENIQMFDKKCGGKTTFLVSPKMAGNSKFKIGIYFNIKSGGI